ncbi:MAG TPA: alpha/beta hydrolase family protein [Gemmatimonadaceae bacterium]
MSRLLSSLRPWASIVAIVAIVAISACTAAHHGGASTSLEPANEPSRGSVHQDVFVSQALGATKRLYVYLPPSYGRDASKRYPVAYYLHGLYGSEMDWLAKGNIDAAADSLIAHGMPETIIVLPDGDDGWYTTWTAPVGYNTCADTLHVEAPSRYCVANARYDDYIARDVVKHIDDHYRTKRNRESRGIGGLSMGGYGAVALALHYPDVFGLAASHSGVVSPMYVGPHPFAAPAQYGQTAEELKEANESLWPRYAMYWATDLARWRVVDPTHMAESAKQRGQLMPMIFFDCGTEDGLVDENRAFHAELTRLGIQHQYAEWPGAHTWRYWSTHVPESLAWMGRNWR